MFIRFSVENFLSFKEQQTFSMIAGAGRKKPFHLIKKSNRNDISLLKTAVIFGANASGKSNLVRSIDFGQQLILKGTPPDSLIRFEPFRLHEESRLKPSKIEYEFKHQGQAYAYGFIFTQRGIREEWLYRITRHKEYLLFDRNEQDGFDLSALYKLNPDPKEQQFLEFIAKSTPDNQLFLTEIKHRKVKDNVTNIDHLLRVIDWFQNALTVLYPDSKINGLEFELQTDATLATIFEEFLHYFDTGVDGIDLREVPIEELDVAASIKERIRSDLLHERSEKQVALLEDPINKLRYIFSKKGADQITVHKLMTKHKVGGQTTSMHYFDVNEESDGTQRLIDFIPVLIDLFEGDNVFVIDEMERSLHPNLIYDLLDLFLERSQGTPSQLILASHAASLLSQRLLRKDEVWFVAKDTLGASSLYSLEEYDVQFDHRVRKDYLIGRYSAIPRLGNRNKLSPLPPSTNPDHA